LTWPGQEPSSKKPTLTLRERRLLTEVSDLKTEVSKLSKAYAQAADLTDAISGHISAMPPPPPMKMPRPKKHSGHLSMGLAINDWHTGLVVAPDEIQGYGEYNWKIAERRRAQLLKKLINWVTMQRNSYRVDEIVVINLGDLNDGCIHLENLMFNEFAPAEQAIRSGTALGQLLVALSGVFPKVRYHGLNTDNHGRLFKKPIFQGRGHWSFNPVTHAIARQLATDCKGVEFHEHNELKVDVEINGRVFLIEHGDAGRSGSWMGIPYYWVRQLKHRECDRRSRIGKRPFDYFLCGHWHTFYIEENAMISPSLCGTTPYDHACARHASPAQVCWLVGRHGWFGHLKMDLN